MERTIVIYKGKYGATDQYAKWLGEDLNCPVKELSEVKKKDLEDYDLIIYGGGVHAGGIRGWDTMRKWLKGQLQENYYLTLENPEYKSKKNVVLFTVGINVQSFKTRSQLRDVNFDKKWLKVLTCYFLDGAYDPSKVKGIDLLIMKYMKKTLREKGLNMTPDEKELLQRVENGCNLVDRGQLERMVSAIEEEYGYLEEKDN